MSTPDQSEAQRIKTAGAALLDRSQPLAARFRALFVLRNLNGPAAVRHIVDCFQGEDSALLKHELAYCLGQMGASDAIADLTRILSLSTSEHPMVRHECAEALGAIGDNNETVLEALRRHADPAVEPAHEVRQTCELALRRLQWLKEGHGPAAGDQCPFLSVDPSPADDRHEKSDSSALSDILCDPEKPLWDRYTAMFALRNRNTEKSALALSKGLQCDDSALLRHEVAYVLGQMRAPCTALPLAARLALPNEASMVRHECAEALGSIATDECSQILSKYLKEEDRIVRESVEVALDMAEYEKSDSFQIAVGGY